MWLIKRSLEGSRNENEQRRRAVHLTRFCAVSLGQPMPLDEVGRRYAHTLYVDKLEQLSTAYATDIREVSSKFAARGELAQRSGLYFSAIAHVGIRYVSGLADAMADTRLAAYQRAALPIDNQAVADIHKAAVEVCDIQGRNLATNIRQKIGAREAPAGMAGAIVGQIESA